MLLCMGELPVRFLWCQLLLFISFLIFISFLYLHFHFWSSFCCCSSFVDVLHSHFPHPSVDYRRVFTPILYFQPSSSQSDLRHFHFQPFQDLLVTVLPRALQFWVGIFYPRAFFTLGSFTDILPAFIKERLSLPGSRQFSSWSWKHRPGSSVCLIHSNPRTLYSEEFIFKFYQTLSWIACGESLIYLLLTRFELFSLVQSICKDY